MSFKNNIRNVIYVMKYKNENMYVYYINLSTNTIDQIISIIPRTKSLSMIFTINFKLSKEKIFLQKSMSEHNDFN